MVAGRELTPADAENTERLLAFWSHGRGSTLIDWGTPGDFDRCVTQLGRFVGPEVVKGLCAHLHHRATGAWPGHAPGEQAAHDAKKG